MIHAEIKALVSAPNFVAATAAAKCGHQTKR